MSGVRQALDLYRTVQDKDPDFVTALAPGIRFPKRLGVRGRARRILYRSGKWKESVKKGYYLHDYETLVLFCEPWRQGLKSVRSPKRLAQDLVALQQAEAPPQPGLPACQKQQTFAYSVEIPLPAGATSRTPGTFTVSHDGPFVALALQAAWRETQGAFAGRWLPPRRRRCISARSRPLTSPALRGPIASTSSMRFPMGTRIATGKISPFLRVFGDLDARRRLSVSRGARPF